MQLSLHHYNMHIIIAIKMKIYFLIKNRTQIHLFNIFEKINVHIANVLSNIEAYCKIKESNSNFILLKN